MGGGGGGGHLDILEEVYTHIYHKPTLVLLQALGSNCKQDYSYGFSDTSSFSTLFGFFQITQRRKHI